VALAAIHALRVIATNLFASGRARVTSLAILTHENAMGNHGGCERMSAGPGPQILGNTHKRVASEFLIGLLEGMALKATALLA
jgi:hypothetical protein